MRFTKVHLDACKRTLEAYVRLIAAPERHAPEWVEYGNPNTCRLCRTSDPRGNPHRIACRYCAIGGEMPDLEGPCTGDGSCYRSLRALVRDPVAPLSIREVASLRLRWLTRKMRSRGLTVKGCEVTQTRRKKK
jgi:hypothetical protein